LQPFHEKIAGSAYHHHWPFEDCRKVLTAVGELEPVMPPFDPSKIVPFDFEADVERLIEQTLAEKNKRGSPSSQPAPRHDKAGYNRKSFVRLLLPL
jgi:hypothetical protein